MTMQNLLQQCRKKSHSKVRRFWVVLAAVALLLVLACRGYDWDALGRYKGDNISSLHYVRGRVVEVLRDDTKPDQLDPARSMGTQELRILLLEGANKGTEVTIANYLTRTQNVRLRQGETAIICEDLPDSADAYYTVYNYDRAPVLVLILAVFAAKTAGAADGTTVAILDAANVEALRTVFWDMTKLTSSSREVEHPAGPGLYRGNDCLVDFAGHLPRAAVPAAYGGGAGCVHPGQPAAAQPAQPQNMGGHAFHFGGRGAGGRCVLPVQHAAAPFRHERYQR